MSIFELGEGFSQGFVAKIAVEALGMAFETIGAHDIASFNDLEAHRALNGR